MGNKRSLDIAKSNSHSPPDISRFMADNDSTESSGWHNASNYGRQSCLIRRTFQVKGGTPFPEETTAAGCNRNMITGCNSNVVIGFWESQVATATCLSAFYSPKRYPEGYHFLDLLHPIQAYLSIHSYYLNSYPTV
jgi:hypothetical protein